MLFDQFNIFEIKYMAGIDAKWRMHLFVVKKKKKKAYVSLISKCNRKVYGKSISSMKDLKHD